MKKNEEEVLGSMPEPEQDNSNKIKMLKGLAIVFFAAFIVLLMGSIMLKNVPDDEESIFPPSGLSQSIFESQNGAYIANESLPFNHVFELIPYYIDVPSDKSANVGSGTSYTITSEDFTFVTEYKKADVNNLPNLVAEQLGKAYVLELCMDNCILQENIREDGFMNGYAMTYITYTAQFADADNRGYIAYIAGYQIEVTDDVFVYIAVSTTTGTREAMDTYKAWLDAIACTLRYDETLDNERKALEQQEADKKQEEQEAQEQAQEEMVEEEKTTAQSYYEQWYAMQHETVQIVADGTGTQKLDVELESRYKNAVLRFVFSEPTDDFEYHLVDPEGISIEMTELTVVGDEELAAIYSIDDSKQGVYSIVFDKGGCTYITPAFTVDSHMAYSSTELMMMEQAENSNNTDVNNVPNEESDSGAGEVVVATVPPTE